MKAIVTKQFPGRRDHLTVSEVFPVGVEIEGDLAVAAVDLGFAKPAGKAPKSSPPQIKTKDMSKLDRGAVEELATELNVTFTAETTMEELVASVNAAAAAQG